ncbi:Holliday junction branch migration protein RuvA [Isachenkonia alkalipeptolytica]|uniref:Holliday junction branch migration complex subunit RuvA n=1 Tax=Isachenkonia alkalipeptolytica TaxID=2565777 RepID=A0AA43XLI2_9CLOT|nr:Holliday junction branch migration protein RuvA [Isachenkonia alkalipeptolytica]NBG88922.1 Holliday junction branch migration protein RuvA [Isachenkonia alkalipeptolytica]
MFAFIDGKIHSKDLGSIILEVNGIGYKVHTTENTINQVQVGEKTIIHTHLVVRDDEMVLFGFNSKEELKMFHQLRSVSKIGAKVACGILSHFTPEELTRNIYEGSIGNISKAPGVGKKTAERMVVELKDKLSAIDLASATVEPETQKEDVRHRETVDALMSLGYTKQEGQKAVKSLESETLSVDEMIKESLKLLMKS